MIVAGDEVDSLGHERAADLRFEQLRSQSLEKQRGGGGIPVVDLVAHMERLSDQRLQFDRSADVEGGGEDLAELGRHPPQARQHRRPVGAEPERFAEAFIQV